LDEGSKYRQPGWGGGGGGSKLKSNSESLKKLCREKQFSSFKVCTCSGLHVKGRSSLNVVRGGKYVANMLVNRLYAVTKLEKVFENQNMFYENALIILIFNFLTYSILAQVPVYL
jgi:hypothetical protein